MRPMLDSSLSSTVTANTH